MKKYISIAAALVFGSFVSAQNIDLNQMPKPGPTPVINIAKPKTFKLKNGLTVLVVENRKLPRVNVSLTMDRPPVLEGDKAGVTGIMAEQLGSGTTTMSKDEFNRKVDFLGANLNFSSGGASANTLSKYFPEVLNLMADAIVNPKFSAEEVQKSKERAIEGLKTEEKSADAIANRVYSALNYGKNTSRGEFETEQSLNKIQLADVQQMYQQYYAPDNAYLVVVGDVQYNAVKKMIENKFGAWKKANTKFAALEPALPVAKTEINVVDHPTAVQSVITVGNLTDLRMNNPKYFAATIANYILGGGAESRLFMNLREKNGFTYGAYSGLNTGKYSQSFSANSSVRNEVTDKAVTEFLNELRAIQNITPEELASAKEKLKGSFIMSLERPETIARFAVNRYIHQLPETFYTNYLRAIDDVTLAQVKDAAKENLLADKSRILVVGKGTEIADQLEKLGYPVSYYDKYANSVTKPTAPKMDANLTIADISKKYLDAIGGRAAVEKIYSLKSVSEAKMQGMPIEMTVVSNKGGKISQSTSVMGKKMQSVVFDGKDGYMEVMGKKNPIDADTKAGLVKNTELFPELLFGKSDAYTLVGIENVDGADNYVVKGPDVTYYFNTKTGLKAKEVKKQKAMGREMEVPTYYSGYKAVNGVLLPHVLKSTIQGMDVQFDVKSYEVNTAKETDFK